MVQIGIFFNTFYIKFYKVQVQLNYFDNFPALNFYKYVVLGLKIELY